MVGHLVLAALVRVILGLLLWSSWLTSAGDAHLWAAPDFWDADDIALEKVDHPNICWWV